MLKKTIYLIHVFQVKNRIKQQQLFSPEINQYFVCVTVGKLMEMHGEGGTKTVVTDTGEKIDRVNGFEPPVLDFV